MDNCSPSFFKFIGSARDLQKLMIPPAFTKEFVSIFSESDTAYLTAGGGSEYEVKLERKGGDVLFSSGWEKLMEFYNVKLGYFLVFDYQGSSRFDVGISDLSNCEIDYDEFHSQSPDHVEEDGDEEEDEDEEDDESDEESMEMELMRGKEAMSETREKAEQFSCRKPSFIKTMTSSYVSGGDFRLWVPLVHGKRYLKKGDSTAKLRVGKEKTRIWHVTVNSKLDSKPSSIRFSAGWNAFVEDNRLRVDDVCKFELTDHATQTYRVHIFRHDDNTRH